LEILDLETGKVTDLSKVGKDAAWSPNGRYIAYVVEPSFDSYQEDVCLSDQTGGNVRMLTEGAYPGWSGDSRFLYFYSRSKHRILSIDVSQPSAQATVFFDHPSSQYPAVSPDGSMVAFGTAGKLVIAKARTGEQLWNWPVVNARGLLPAWSPDGKLVGFGGYDGDELGLWVFRISSGTASCIVRGPCTMPAWSNDGEKLAFDYRPKKQDKWEVWEALPPLNGRKPDDASPFWRTNQF
jgi:Tol biopolymer transport system component